MISFGCRRITSSVGVRSMRFSWTSFAKTGVSRIRSRMYSPIPTRTMESANGTRHPQARKASPDIWLKASTARLARNSPAGTPNCGHEAAKPRWALVLVHSIDISTEPPHSPPTPTPWMKRRIVRSTAPQMPIEA